MNIQKFKDIQDISIVHYGNYSVGSFRKAELLFSLYYFIINKEKMKKNSDIYTGKIVDMSSFENMTVKELKSEIYLNLPRHSDEYLVIYEIADFQKIPLGNIRTVFKATMKPKVREALETYFGENLPEKYDEYLLRAVNLPKDEFEVIGGLIKLL